MISAMCGPRPAPTREEVALGAVRHAVGGPAQREAGHVTLGRAGSLRGAQPATAGAWMAGIVPANAGTSQAAAFPGDLGGLLHAEGNSSQSAEPAGAASLASPGRALSSALAGGRDRMELGVGVRDG